MATVCYNDKAYELDSKRFLKNFEDWDEDFPRAMAEHLGMHGDLTKDQWDVIKFIRDTYKSTGRCPNLYETRRKFSLNLEEMSGLFPTGYLRGACRLAGITYKEGYTGESPKEWGPYVSAEDIRVMSAGKTYRVDVNGFLVNPEEWDECYAIMRAVEMKIPGGKLTELHWQIIEFLREAYQKTKQIPTVYETCEKSAIDVTELEQLFPDGYHRGAIKIAGLRLR